MLRLSYLLMYILSDLQIENESVFFQVQYSAQSQSTHIHVNENQLRNIATNIGSLPTERKLCE